jgi:serine/threonine-protein kinase
MKILEGITLSDLLKTRQFQLDEIVSITNKLCSALQCLHEKDIVHRDVKPSNVMVGRFGEVTLLDLGIAREVETGVTETGAMIGTRGYMAPEQLYGKRVDHRCDIYAMGAVMYELLTGTRLFDSRDDHDVIPDAPLRSAGLTGSMRVVLERALAKDPKARFQSTVELAATFEAAVARHPDESTAREGHALPPTRQAPPTRAEPRRKVESTVLLPPTGTIPPPRPVPVTAHLTKWLPEASHSWRAFLSGAMIFIVLSAAASLWWILREPEAAGVAGAEVSPQPHGRIEQPARSQPRIESAPDAEPLDGGHGPAQMATGPSQLKPEEKPVRPPEKQPPTGRPRASPSTPPAAPYVAKRAPQPEKATAPGKADIHPPDAGQALAVAHAAPLPQVVSASSTTPVHAPTCADIFAKADRLGSIIRPKTGDKSTKWNTRLKYLNERIGKISVDCNPGSGGKPDVRSPEAIRSELVHIYDELAVLELQIETEKP